MLTNEPFISDCEQVATPSGVQRRSLLSGALRPAWLGQMVASMCWIRSVFVYGISSTGDWLQLAAAASWAVANVAALLTGDA